MAKIGVDIDSTLYDFTTPFREAFLDLAEQDPDLDEEDKEKLFRGLYFPWLEWRSPIDAVGLPLFERALHMVHDDGMILRQKPFPRSRETLQELADAGHELLYVSNRASESLDATNQWLMANDFPHGELQVVEHSKIDSLADCQYVIDDRPRTLVEFVYDYDWQAGELTRAFGEHVSTHGPYRDNEAYLEAVEASKQATARRKGFGIMYEYNRNLTDVRGVYLAPTWAGLRWYLRRKEVL